MRKRVLMWLMVLCLMLPTVTVNAAEITNGGGSATEAGQVTQETTLPSAVPETEVVQKATEAPTVAQTEEPIEPTAIPEPEETAEPVVIPTQEPEETAEPVVTPTQEPEEMTEPTALPTQVPEKTVLPTSAATIEPDATVTPTATAAPVQEAKKGTYTLSHSGILQEGQFSGDEAVKAGELGGNVDIEGVKEFIVQGLMETRTEIDISEYQIPVVYIDLVISEVLNENPRFFYVSFNECSVEGEIVTLFTPDYDDDLLQAANEYEMAVAKALSKVDSSMNNVEKAMVLHDYLVTHCEYDLSYQRYTAYDALVTGSAVCQGYALAYYDIMDRAGVPCSFAISDAMNHIWNMVYIDGSWYHVDATWDDPSNLYMQSYCGHENFLVSDSRLLENKHYSWYGEAVASSTRFDNAVWKDVDSIVYKYDGAWYYMGVTGKTAGLVRRTGSLEGGTSSIVHQIKEPWPVWGESGWWNALFSYLVPYDNALYFNTHDSVYKLTNGSVKKCFDYMGGKGYLYDIIVVNDKLYCGVTQIYDAAISYVEVVDFPFSDVEVIPGHWKYDSIKYVYDNNIMNGINGTTRFDPDEPLTRAMFATVLYRMAGSPPVTFENHFSDVVNGRYYSNAIIWAYKNNIVNGYADGSYGIDDNITREQIAKMLRVYADLRGYNTGEQADIQSFPDVKDVSGWAVGHVQWAVGCKMINGKNIDGTYYLDPKGEATRAECAAMLNRFQVKYEG